MIKAVLFDFFGVLTKDGVSSFKQYYLESGGDPKNLDKVDRLVGQLTMADLRFSKFIRQLSELVGKDEATVRKDLSHNRPNKQLVDYIRKELKPKYKLGIISNAGGDWLYTILPEEDVELFDDIVISHREGMAKPQEAIYEKSLQNLGIRADESVFVDDIDRYVDAAKKIGMKAILYNDFPQMKRELEEILPSSDN